MHHEHCVVFHLMPFHLSCFPFEFQTNFQILFHACHVTMFSKHLLNRKQSNCFIKFEFQIIELAQSEIFQFNVKFIWNSIKFKTAQTFENFKNKSLCTWAFWMLSAKNFYFIIFGVVKLPQIQILFHLFTKKRKKK